MAEMQNILDDPVEALVADLNSQEDIFFSTEDGKSSQADTTKNSLRKDSLRKSIAKLRQSIGERPELKLDQGFLNQFETPDAKETKESSIKELGIVKKATYIAKTPEESREAGTYDSGQLKLNQLKTPSASRASNVRPDLYKLDMFGKKCAEEDLDFQYPTEAELQQLMHTSG